jgi:hypothetical protein
MHNNTESVLTNVLASRRGLQKITVAISGLNFVSHFAALPLSG